MAATVDEERRRARDAAEVGAVDVLGDPGSAGALAESVRELLDVEPELLGIADEILPLQRVLVGEEQVVHLPERALIGSGLAGLGCELRAQVDVVQGQVAPDVLQIAGAGEQLADDGLGLATEGALEVAVLDDRDRRVVGAAGVVTLRIDIEVEIGERLGAACEGADPQPARQPGRGAEQEPREERRDEPRCDDPDLRVGQRVALERE